MPERARRRNTDAVATLLEERPNFVDRKLRMTVVVRLKPYAAAAARSAANIGRRSRRG
jgi:hypothetical protein